MLGFVSFNSLLAPYGLRILRDTAAGRTNPGHLAQHRDHRCKASAAEITAALAGHYRPEHVFVLKQNLELFDSYQRQLASCDTEIEALLQTLAAETPEPVSPLPARRSNRKPRDNEPRFEIRVPLHQLTGSDLSRIDAIALYTALRLVSEIGSDISPRPSLPPPASSPSSSTEPSRATSRTRIPVPPSTTLNNEVAFSAACLSVRHASVSISSTARPASYSRPER